MEYVGEILGDLLFSKRVEAAARRGQEHFYFMALTTDAIIDATRKGNISRFINHSCEPNAETQKVGPVLKMVSALFVFKDSAH